VALSGIPTLVKDGLTYNTNLNKSNILNQHFYSVFAKDSSSALPDLGPSPYPELPPFDITVTGVPKLLQEVDLFKATGPDEIPSRLLKEMSCELAPSLTLIFKASIHQSNLPSDWKTALVTPLLKKGSRSNPTNYHPISLTSICCKLLEHIIYSNIYIMSHLNLHNILSSVQFGFWEKHSAELFLLCTIHDFALNLNCNQTTDAIFLDFCKVFDKVPHHHLKLKLEYYGIKNSVLQWISSFLHSHTQQVVCGGSISDPVNVTSGVSQGTVLGPLLFLIYINDLPDCITSSCGLFADDCLLYRKIVTIKRYSKIFIMQKCGRENG